MSETDLKRAIAKRLELHGWLVTRVQCGGYRGRMAFAKPGTEDLACMAPGGRYVAVETKIRGGRLSEAQIKRSGEVIKRGGIYLVMRCTGDADAAAADIGGAR